MVSKLGNGEYCIIDASYLNNDLIKNKIKISKNVTYATYKSSSILIGTIENSCGSDIYYSSRNIEFILSREIVIIPSILIYDTICNNAHFHYFIENVTLKERRGVFTIMDGNNIYMTINTKTNS